MKTKKLDLKNSQEETERIKKIVCKVLNVKPEELTGLRRFKEVAIARHFYSYMLYKYNKMSLKEVGATFIKNRDHSTVLHSCRMVEIICSYDVEYIKKKAIIEKKIVYENYQRRNRDIYDNI